MTLCCLQQAMWIKDEFLGCSFIEVFVTLWSVIQFDNCGVDRFCNLYLVMQNSHHQFTMIAHHWTLPGCESVGLRPAKSYPDAELTDLGLIVNSAGVSRHI